MFRGLLPLAAEVRAMQYHCLPYFKCFDANQISPWPSNSAHGSKRTISVTDKAYGANLKADQHSRMSTIDGIVLRHASHLKIHIFRSMHVRLDHGIDRYHITISTLTNSLSLA